MMPSLRFTLFFMFVDWLHHWLCGRSLGFLTDESDEFERLRKANAKTDVVDISTATIKKLQQIGFTRTRAKQLHAARSSPSWKRSFLYLPKSQGEF